MNRKMDRTARHAPVPPEEADLGQSITAGIVLDHLRNSEQIHVALTGPYGSGKSRVLKLVEDGLTDLSVEVRTKKVLKVKYHPWRYSPDATTLRRTFLKEVHAAAEAASVPRLPALEATNFFENLKGERPATPAEVKGSAKLRLREVGANVGVQAAVWGAVFVGLFAIIFALSIIDALTPLEVPGALYTSAAALQIGLLVYLFRYTIKTLKDVKVKAVAEVVVPRVSAIDQFEDKYRGILKALHDAGYRLVVLVDDLDRCQGEEIRTVLAGLATYMGSEGRSSQLAPVSFVVAIDATRAEASLAADESANSRAQANGRGALRRFNYLGKHFHAFVTVPQPTIKQLESLVVVTAGGMGWNLPRSAVVQIAKSAADWCEGNLRATRSALEDAFATKRFAETILESRPDDLNIRRIADSPLHLFRIALIRAQSTDWSLREFVMNARYWVRNEVPTGFAAELLSAHPPFRADTLDPRELLQLGPPSSQAFEGMGTPEYVKRLKDLPDDRFRAEVAQPLNPWNRVEAAAYLLIFAEQATRDGQGADARAKIVHKAVLSLEAAGDFLGPDQADVFRNALRLVSDRNVAAQFPASDIKVVVRAASLIGGPAFSSLLANDSSFIQDRLEPIRQAVAELAPKLREDVIVAYLEFEQKRAVSAPEALRITPQFQALRRNPHAMTTPGFGRLALTLLRQWPLNPSQHPPQDLWDKPVQEAIYRERLEAEARTWFAPVLANTKSNGGFGEKLFENGWEPFAPRSGSEVRGG